MNQLDKLTERFGSELELLDRSQKLQLRISLTTFIWGFEEQGEDYTLEDSWLDSINNIIERDRELDEVFAILRDIAVDDAESLLEALQAQCRYGNARVKTPTESMTDQLVKHGVLRELAKTAANILMTVDSTRERTPQEQQIIGQLHQSITHNALHNRFQ